MRELVIGNQTTIARREIQNPVAVAANRAIIDVDQIGSGSHWFPFGPKPPVKNWIVGLRGIPPQVGARPKLSQIRRWQLMVWHTCGQQISEKPSVSLLNGDFCDRLRFKGIECIDLSTECFHERLAPNPAIGPGKLINSPFEVANTLWHSNLCAQQVDHLLT